MQLLTHLLPSALAKDTILAWSSVEATAKGYSKEVLLPAELEEYYSFESAARRREYLATRGLIRQMAEHLKLDPHLFSLQKDELGKPYGIYQNERYHMGIAHTKMHVLCGLGAHRALGVDLESVERKVPGPLKSRILTHKEALLLAGEPVVRLWTIKEALVKLQGKGMRTNLKDCTLLAKKGNEFTAKFNDDKRAKICSFSHCNNWMAFAWNC